MDKITGFKDSIAFPLQYVVIPCQSSVWFSWCKKDFLSTHTRRATEFPGEYLSRMTEQDKAQQEILCALFYCNDVADYFEVWLYAFAIEASYYKFESETCHEISTRIIQAMAQKFKYLNIPKHIHKLLPSYISRPEHVVDNESYIDWAAQNISTMLKHYAPVKHGA